MDPKTKALLHTSGAVLASDDPQHGLTEFTVFPPAMGMVVSEQAMMHAPTGDKKTLVARLAQMIGKSVAKAVEEQILKAYEMDAKSAMALIMEAKKSFFADSNTMWHPSQGDPFKIEDGQFVTQPAPAWSKPSTNVWQDIKDAMAKMDKVKVGKGGILNLQDPDSIWDLPKGQPLFFHGGPHGHMVAVDPAAVSPEPGAKAKPNAITQVFHDLIPGFAEMRQPCPHGPCPWSKENPFLEQTIIHLNDLHKWTRERIADWLETLDHDLTFKTPEEVKTEQEKAEMLKNMIGQPLVPDPDLIKELMGEGVNNGNSDTH